MARAARPPTNNPSKRPADIVRRNTNATAEIHRKSTVAHPHAVAKKTPCPNASQTTGTAATSAADQPERAPAERAATALHAALRDAPGDTECNQSTSGTPRTVSQPCITRNSSTHIAVADRTHPEDASNCRSSHDCPQPCDIRPSAIEPTGQGPGATSAYAAPPAVRQSARRTPKPHWRSLTMRLLITFLAILSGIRGRPGGSHMHAADRRAAPRTAPSSPTDRVRPRTPRRGAAASWTSTGGPRCGGSRCPISAQATESTSTRGATPSSSTPGPYVEDRRKERRARPCPPRTRAIKPTPVA